MERESILIIEDDIQVLSSFERILSGDGYEITAVNNGDKALKLLKNRKYNLVLTDIVMKGIDGLQVLEEIKMISPETVVILITGYGVIETAIEAIRKGVNDYILKPCDEGELRSRVKQALEKQRLGEKF